jgi:hypothetical protein
VCAEEQDLLLSMQRIILLSCELFFPWLIASLFVGLERHPVGVFWDPLIFLSQDS